MHATQCRSLVSMRASVDAAYKLARLRAGTAVGELARQRFLDGQLVAVETAATRSTKSASADFAKAPSSHFDDRAFSAAAVRSHFSTIPPPP